MRKSDNHRGGMWEYLDSRGILENGSDEAIKQAKKDYRKLYFTKHKQKQRSLHREYTIRFRKGSVEYVKVTGKAKQHNMKVTAFIQSAVMAYINKIYIVPDRLQIARLEQITAQCLNEIQTIVKQKEKYNYEREQKYEILEKRFGKLEEDISTVLKCPYTIEELVLKGIKEKPSLQEVLLALLTTKNNDYQNQIT
jgi:hypothetical protein